MQRQLEILTGTTLYEVLTDAATAMDAGGLVKPEINAALDDVAVDCTDGGLVDAPSVAAPADPPAVASDSLVSAAASGLEMFNHQKLLSLFNNSCKARELREVVAINGSKFPAKPAHPGGSGALRQRQLRSDSAGSLR